MKLPMLFLALVAMMIAADPTGVWKAEYTTPNGDQRTSTFHLKAEGDKLTGKVVTTRGETEIKNGTIKGDDVAFDVVRNFNGNEFTMKYAGKVEADEIKMKVSFGEDRTMDVVAKRTN
jgi:uncharacterized protein (DUF2147 family)